MMEPVLKVFVAGSKDLKNERMICRSVCNRLQNQWGIIVTKSFEDFPETISREGHQNEYNTFIREQADVVMFVFSGKVGEITRAEFEHAWHAFTENGHPQILVYIDQSEQAASSDIDDLKSLLSAKGQYYMEYADTGQLEQMMEQHLNKILVNLKRKIPSDIKETDTKETDIKESGGLLKALGVTAWIVGIWCLLALIGGVGMYIYDCRLSRTECINLAARYVEAGRNGEVMYYFPDATYVYDSQTGTLDIMSRENKASSADVTLAKMEHAAFGATASLLFARVFKFKAKGNGKALLGYMAGIAAGVVGCGVGCVVEQMIFPPQYSRPVRELLSEESNWPEVIGKSNPSHWF